MSRRKLNTFAPCLAAFQALEPRDCMAVESIELSGNVLVVRSDDSATSIRIESSQANLLILEGQTSWTYLAASIGQVEFHGGEGSDRVVNTVAGLPISAYGEGGNDQLIGRGGNDLLAGGTGDDTLIGNGGADTLLGDDGNDLIIAIDSAATDELFGGAGIDTLWFDGNPSISDRLPSGADGDVVQKVDRFTNGADRTLDGDNIADPKIKSLVYRRFASNPLFSSAGPQPDDMHQGNLADCWLLAGLSAIAMDNQQAIEQNVVDFGDGSFGVRLGDKFYRVDSDLPTKSKTNFFPAYAGLGNEDSLWVAVVEKAFVYHRSTKKEYASLNGGWGVEVNKAFRSSATGFKELKTYSSAAALASDLYQRFSTKQAVTIGIIAVKPGMKATAPLRKAHMYSVSQVELDSAGNVSTIVLRNPWGFDGAGSDSNPNDGLVSMTASQLFAYTGRLNWGKV